MTEFVEVMKQANRMCHEFRSGLHKNYCDDCPVSSIRNGKDSTCTEVMRSDPEWFEKIVMDWAEKNPEPVYPTWKEWQAENFPNYDALMRPCAFEAEEYFGCKNFIGCEQCINTPIPADIAEKLGIKLIGGVSDENA